ncbi:hypothetical protein BOX15_Mlig010516g1 [Macrostomum lignano]|uniref:RING-type domain-containing protein n=1 Tax=Macrostomum lignano TaxID=282301 RepID=A0A267GTD2_9PLAT|nr:hypothetical protein BOX15_Mlig010516g1 [Macrostomum lignano]
MSEAKRIRLADPSELSAAPASSSAVESEPSPQLMELVQDCTCPVCKEIFTEPVALVACGHAFCRRCYEKLCRKCATTETGIGGGFAFLLAPPSSLAAEQQRRVACPVCRVKFRPGSDAVKPDSQAECLVRALMLVKAPQQTVDASLPTPGDVDRSDGCCSASTDCWRRRAVRCTDCGVASCRAHHESALASLRSSAAEVAAAGATFASDESAGVGPLRRLTDMRLRLPNLRRALADRLTARLDAYEARLEDASVRVRQAAEASLDRRQHLAGLVHRLESVTAAAAAVGGDAIDASYAEMLTLKSRLTAELAEARSLHPALRVEEPIGLEDLERGLDACLDELTVRLYALPYESLARASTSGAPLAPVRLAPIAHHRTRPRRPWCLRLLKNVSGLRLLNGRLVRSSAASAASASASPSVEDGSEPLPQSGILLVNYSGPTGRLHIFEAGQRIRRLGCLQLQPPRLPGPAIGHGRRRCRPGRIAVCNNRQRIFATDSANNRVMAFHATGRLVASFGCYGDSDNAGDDSLCQDDVGESNGEPNFQRPLGLCVDNEALYVVDSGNCRVQIFCLDSGYRRIGCLRHPDFTAGLHSVLACQSDLVGSESASAPGLVVSDRDTERLFLFDRASRRAIRHLSVGGRPADLSSDRHGNVLVSLAASRQVKVFDPLLTRCLYAFNLDSWSPPVGASEEPATATPEAAAADNRNGEIEIEEEEEDEDDEEQYIGGGWDSSPGSASSAASSAFSLSAAPPLPSVGEFLFSGMSDGRRRRRFVVAGFGGGGGGGGIGGPGDCLQGIALDPLTRRIFAADARRQCLLAYQL